MNTADDKYLHALNTISGVGTQKLRLLFAHFDNAKDAWHGTKTAYEKAGLPKKVTTALLKAQKTHDPDDLWIPLDKEHITLVTQKDPHFPQQLNDLPNAPLFLYVRGNVKILRERSVAIVGSRKFSSYGKQVTTRLAEDLSAHGIHVVSGLALGIDAIAHRAVLHRAGKGKTIAILGGSIDDASIAPRTHTSLAHHILANDGVLLSEYPPPTTPSKGTFPARNRLMAGIASATLVTEAMRDSGTLITAEITTTLQRPLLAVPGSIFSPTSVGVHDLIAEKNALLIRNVDDILHAIGIKKEHPTSQATYTPSTDAEKIIITLLQKHPQGLSIDKIIRHTTLEGTTVSGTLVLMEMANAIEDLGGGIYACKKGITLHT